MRRVGKSRSALVALLVAATALVASPIPAPAQGPDEYQLNLPDGGGGDTAAGGDGGETSAPAEETAPAPTAPVPTAPVPTETTETGETVVVPGGGGRGGGPDRERPEPVFGTTSANATLGAQEIPPLKVRAGEGSNPIVPIGLAVLAGLCCLAAIWRLRFLRELPTAPRPPASRRRSAAPARLQGEGSTAAARVRSGRDLPVSATVGRTRTARGAASS